MIPLAEGVEETEAISVVDILRRAGWEVVTAGLCEGPVRASRGVTLVPDRLLDELHPDAFDLLVIPGGGGGTQRLAADRRVIEWLRAFDEAEKMIGAICAGPKVLHTAGVLEGRRFTCFPGVEKEIGRADRLSDAVVVDDHIVTSQAVGTALRFALKLVALVDGEVKAEQLAEQIVMAAR
jgi:4-methyl-5(b-hydroxyethyl)-thiazole monophosphate biosynthesis